MRCPIHVDDVAEVFARVVLADAPRHPVYNTGGTPISLGEIADMVRNFLPDARIAFEHETGGRDSSGNHLIDNTRLVQEFAVQYVPYRQRVLQIINEVRREEGLPPVSGG
jgi:nucleoside-diphosphate-sugar epimerase